MEKCQICQDNLDRISERIGHEMVSEISEEEGYFCVKHVRPNSSDDKKGIDIFLQISKSGGNVLMIQIKKFRILDEKILRERLARMKEEPKRRRNRMKKISTPAEFREYVWGIIGKYEKLNLLINDQEIKDDFYRLAKELNFFQILRYGRNYEEILKIYGRLEPYFAIFHKAIYHAEHYPDVKLLFIVDLDLNKAQREKTKAEWKRLIKKAIASI